MYLECIDSWASYIEGEDYSILSFTHHVDVMYLRDVTLTKKNHDQSWFIAITSLSLSARRC